jgi:hypothetical protein
LRGLETEFGESSNSIRLELNRLENAGLLRSYSDGNKKMFRANTNHPLYPEINSILRKMAGIDQIIEKVINRLGELNKVFVAGSFANGVDSEEIELVFVGDDIEKPYLFNLIEKAETIIQRRIRYIIYSLGEYEEVKNNLDSSGLLIWERN